MMMSFSFSGHGQHELMMGAFEPGAGVSVTILDGDIDGRIPKRALRLVQEWRKLHRDELMDNWLRARDRRPLEPISPLE